MDAADGVGAWIPAFAGMTEWLGWIPAFADMTKWLGWIPAFADMTELMINSPASPSRSPRRPSGPAR